MLGGLLDPRVQAHPTPTAELAAMKQQPRLFGVGIAFDIVQDHSQIVSGLEPGLSAQRSGLIEEGDEIVKVDGTVVEKAPMMLLRERILGPQGSHVTLMFRRVSCSNTFVFEVELMRGAADYIALSALAKKKDRSIAKLSSRIAQLESSVESVRQEAQRASVQASASEAALAAARSDHKDEVALLQQRIAALAQREQERAVQSGAAKDLLARAAALEQDLEHERAARAKAEAAARASLDEAARTLQRAQSESAAALQAAELRESAALDAQRCAEVAAAEQRARAEEVRAAAARAEADAGATRARAEAAEAGLRAETARAEQETARAEQHAGELKALEGRIASEVAARERAVRAPGPAPARDRERPAAVQRGDKRRFATARSAPMRP